MLRYETLKAWRFPEIERAYAADDSMLYALAVGLGADPLDERQLRFVNDTAPGTPVALPTLAVVLGYAGPWLADPATGIDFRRLVHGEETVEWHRPIRASGTVVARHRVTHVVDKGQGRGAVITFVKELTEKASGALLATVTHTAFARADGGFSQGGASDSPPPPLTKVPERAPDQVVEMGTLPQQALLYRLCGDRNPLHSDPAAAREAGFPRPILHGLATYGVACHAMLAALCEYDPARLARLSVRFSAPVYPGEVLRFEIFAEGAGFAFRARVPERDQVVLDCGRVGLADRRALAPG